MQGKLGRCVLVPASDSFLPWDSRSQELWVVSLFTIRAEDLHSLVKANLGRCEKSLYLTKF